MSLLRRPYIVPSRPAAIPCASTNDTIGGCWQTSAELGAAHDTVGPKTGGCHRVGGGGQRRPNHAFWGNPLENVLRLPAYFQCIHRTNLTQRAEAAAGQIRAKIWRRIFNLRIDMRHITKTASGNLSQCERYPESMTVWLHLLIARYRRHNPFNSKGLRLIFLFCEKNHKLPGRIVDSTPSLH